MDFLITGGAGFIGSNLAKYFIGKGHAVTVLDNLSRNMEFQKSNLEWIQEGAKKRFTFLKEDVRNFEALDALFAKKRFDVVIHQAAQIAVTTSIIDPTLDFQTNAMGTFNLLEAIRKNKQNPIILNASTNKVYGDLNSLRIEELDQRYQFTDLIRGVDESQTLDLQAPYGCSKGTADQYVLDYYRTYGLKTVVFRQSCVYGHRQLGTEDQGWLAWFAIACMLGKPVTIYGDGKQTRDALFIDDLVELYDKAIEYIDRCPGEVFNVGGGIANTVSLRELIELLQQISGKHMQYSFGPARMGDQKIFVSDNAKASRLLDWQPMIDIASGVKKLYAWVEKNASYLKEF